MFYLPHMIQEPFHLVVEIISVYFHSLQELRTPLNAVLGMSQLLAESDLHSDQAVERNNKKIVYALLRLREQKIVRTLLHSLLNRVDNIILPLFSCIFRVTRCHFYVRCHTGNGRGHSHQR